MILIRQLKVAVSEQEIEGIRQAIAKKIHITAASIYEIEILKRSIDARKKPDLFYIYTVAVRLDIHQEKKLLKKCAKDTDISLYQPMTFQMPKSGEQPLSKRPVIVGMGPAGLFCGHAPVFHPFFWKEDAQSKIDRRMWKNSGRPDCLIQSPTCSLVRAEPEPFRMVN